MTQLADVFKLNPEGLNVRRAVGVAVVMVLPLIVCKALGQEVYYVSVAFGALFVGLNDPGGQYGYRLPRLALNAGAGALLTVLGVAIGAGAWGVVVLAAFVVTLLAGLMVKFGLHGFSSAYVLNCWFLVAIAMPVGFHLSHGHTNAWAQGLAWLIGSALTIAWTAIVWLARGRTAQPQPVHDLIPGSTKPVPLTRPVILFALIRAIAVAIAVAIAFGFHLPDADWMPIACLIAMKSSLTQSTLVALQRLAGAIIGAVVAALFLLTWTPRSSWKSSPSSSAPWPGPSARSTTPCTARRWPRPCSSPKTCPTPPTSATRRAGSCSPSPASGSPSSSCSWPACSKSAPPKRHMRHLRHIRHLFLKARPDEQPSVRRGYRDRERPKDLPPAQRRRLIAGAALRAVLVAAVLIVLYYLLPLDRPWDSDTAVRLLIGLPVVAGVVVWGVRTVAGARYPGVRAAEALALILPAFLLLFASTYFVVERNSAASFTLPMNKMTAMTVSAGAVTAAVWLITPGKAWPIIPPSAAASTRKEVPSSSETRRRHS